MKKGVPKRVVKVPKAYPVKEKLFPTSGSGGNNKLSVNGVRKGLPSYGGC